MFLEEIGGNVNLESFQESDETDSELTDSTESSHATSISETEGILKIKQKLFICLNVFFSLFLFFSSIFIILLKFPFRLRNFNWFYFLTFGHGFMSVSWSSFMLSTYKL